MRNKHADDAKSKPGSVARIMRSVLEEAASRFLLVLFAYMAIAVLEGRVHDLRVSISWSAFRGIVAMLGVAVLATAGLQSKEDGRSFFGHVRRILADELASYGLRFKSGTKRQLMTVIGSATVLLLALSLHASVVDLAMLLFGLVAVCTNLISDRVLYTLAAAPLCLLVLASTWGAPPAVITLLSVLAFETFAIAVCTSAVRLPKSKTEVVHSSL